MFRTRLLVVLVAGFGLTTVASAQFIGGCANGACANTNFGTYGPSLFGPNPSGKLFTKREMGGCEPYCANNSYPLSDWAYIRKFCGPQLVPGSCYGHYQTKWRKWEDHCPGQGAATGAVCGPDACIPGSTGPVMMGTPMSAPPAMLPGTAVPVTPPTSSEKALPGTSLGEPRPVDPPKVDLPKVDAPKVETPKIDALQKPDVPKEIKTNVPAPLPSIPMIPIPMPEAGKVNPATSTDEFVPSADVVRPLKDTVFVPVPPIPSK